jgi:hypothetical protein
LLCAATLFTIPGGASGAATLPQLPITGFGQIIEAGNHLFIDDGGGIIEADLTGKVLNTLAPSDAGLINLATDGKNIFGSLPDGVVEFSATTLKGPPMWEIQPSSNLYSVAAESGSVWYFWAGAPLSPGPGDAIGYYGYPTGSSNDYALAPNKPWSSVRMATDPNPTTEGTMVVMDTGATPAKMVTFNVSGAKATGQLKPVSENDAFTDCTGLSDFAVTPGGAHVILACTGAGTALTYDTKTLAAVPGENYASGPSPDSVAVAPDNSGVAIGTDDPTTAALTVFKSDGTVVTKVPLAGNGLTVAPNGLTWSDDGTKLFAVLKGSANNYYLDVLQYPQYKATGLDLTSAGTVPAGAKVHLKGTLTLGGAPAPAGTLVKIFRRPTGSNASTTLTTTTTAGGAFSLADIPPKYGSYYYTAYYATTGTYAPAWHTCLQSVTALHTALRLTASAASVKAGTTVTVTAHLGATHTNRVVSIYAQVSGGSKKLVKRGTVNGKGLLAVSYKITKKTTFSVVFAGDGYYAPATATTAVKAS